MECSSCPCQSIINAFVEADLERSLGRCQSKGLKAACQKMKEAMQNVCLTCVAEVNDNNPSNHGQAFYSLDSGHCQTTASSHANSNEVLSRGDWISSHASYDSQYYQDNTFRPYSGDSPLDSSFLSVKRKLNGHKLSPDNAPDGTPDHQADDDKFLDTRLHSSNPFQDEFSITNLPSSVESIILTELNNFAALPPLHQMLVCCLLAGINISDFARMGWLPKEIRNRMRPKENEDDYPVSPQTAHAIYQNICKKLPYMTVLARATKKRSKVRVETQKAAIKAFQNINTQKTKYLSSPENLQKLGRPKTNPHIYDNNTPPSPREARKGKKKQSNPPKHKQQALNEQQYQQLDMFAAC